MAGLFPGAVLYPSEETFAATREPVAPTPAVLDPGDRSDENPLSWGSRWRAAGSVPALKLEGHQFRNVATGTTFAFAGVLWWEKWSDGEIGVPLLNAPTQLTRCAARCDSTFSNGYMCDFTGGKVRIRKIVEGKEELLEEAARTVALNGEVRFKPEGVFLGAWYKAPEGEWELVAFAEDDQFDEGFYGLFTNSPNTRYGPVLGSGVVSTLPALPKATAGIKFHRYAISSTLTDPITHPEGIVICHWWNTDRIKAARKVGAKVLVYQNLTRCHDPGEDERYSTALTIKEAEEVGAKTSNLDTDAGYVCDPGNVAYQELALERMIEKAELCGADGVFCDDMNAFSAITGMSDDEWRTRMQTCNEYVGAGLKAAGLEAFANMAGATGQRNIETNGWVEGQFEFYDGGLDEFFVTFPYGEVESLARIEESAAIMHRQQAAGKKYLPLTNTSDPEIMRFAIGLCLLHTAGEVYFYGTRGPIVEGEFTPDYRFETWGEAHEEARALGRPVSEAKATPTGWERRFARGTVFVDFVTKTATFWVEKIHIAVSREFPPDDLAVRISDPRTGRTITRLAADEGKDENVINDLSKSSEMQGGCKEFGGSLPRSPRIQWPDLAPYLDVTIYGPGVDEVWWGRIDKPQGSEGSQTLVEPRGVGHLAALEDNTAILDLGFINADQTKWGDPSTERRQRLIESSIRLVASTSFGFASKQPEKQPPGIINDFTGVTAVEGSDEAGEAHFDSDGVDIERVLYDYRQLSGLPKDTDWQSNIALGTTDTFDVAEPGTDHDRTTALQQQVAAPGEGYRYARLRDRYAGASTGEMTDLTAWQNLRVLALTGLALQGTWPNVGYTAKQMLEYAVPRYSYLSADADDIEDDGFVIPHAWFSDAGDLATVVKELTKYGLLDWFVKDGKRLQLRFPGTYGRRWVAAPGPAELSEDGEDGTRLWREIVVAFQDVDGTTKYVGPPGSGATYEHAGLEITDPDHPAIRAGITRRDLLVTKSVGDLPSSIKLGENWLEAANELSKSGSCNLSGYVMDDRGILRPAAQVEAGDEVFFPGSTDPSYRRITSVEYQHPERKAACKLDAPPDGLAAIQERFQVELKSWGIG